MDRRALFAPLIAHFVHGEFALQPARVSKSVAVRFSSPPPSTQCVIACVPEDDIARDGLGRVAYKECSERADVVSSHELTFGRLLCCALEQFIEMIDARRRPRATGPGESALTRMRLAPNSTAM